MSEKSAESMQENTDIVSKKWLILSSQLVALLVAIIFIFHETAWSMVSIWYRSETFAHGFIILPITLWLIWEKRKFLSNLSATPEYRALILLAGSGFVWLLGYLVSALVIQQLALVAMLITSVWVVLGNRITWMISFPLAYLFFAVPMGEDLVPMLMEITATFTVGMIKLTGIPVFREGLYFSLPSGNWNVVEACSGVRYLIASVTLGALYAYLTYQSLSKRIIFIIVSAIVPIFANSVRAYIIVMLGHMSDMTIATGVDHLIYGWLFFGLVMLILFWIGAKWRDPEADIKRSDHEAINRQTRPDINRSFVAAVLVVLVMNGVWPILAVAIESNISEIPQAEIEPPRDISGWLASDTEYWHWKPLFLGADKRIDQFYRNQSTHVLMSAGQYIEQQQGEEMINSQNLLINPDQKNWRIIHNGKRAVSFNGHQIDIAVNVLEGEGKKLLVWTWYRVGDWYTSNKYLVKIYEGLLKLTLNKPPSSKITYAIELENELSDSEKQMIAFVRESYTGLLSSLDQVNKK